jgi:hypothetical protein
MKFQTHRGNRAIPPRNDGPNALSAHFIWGKEKLGLELWLRCVAVDQALLST